MNVVYPKTNGQAAKEAPQQKAQPRNRVAERLEKALGVIVTQTEKHPTAKEILFTNKDLGEKQMYWPFFKALRQGFQSKAKGGLLQALWKPGKKYGKVVHHDISGVKVTLNAQGSN